MMNVNEEDLEVSQSDRPLLLAKGEHGDRNYDKENFIARPSRHNVWRIAILIGFEHFILVVAFWYIWTRHNTAYSVDGESPDSKEGALTCLI